MTKILCRRHDCAWCDPDERVCLNTLIAVNEDGCEDYDTIFERPEYQESFWVCVCVDGVPKYRAERMGKRIEYNGRVFYTVEQTNERETFVVTDGITGAEVGTFARVKKDWDKFIAKAAEYPDVMSYPEYIVEQDEEKPVMSSEEFGGLLDVLKRMYGGETSGGL